MTDLSKEVLQDLERARLYHEGDEKATEWFAKELSHPILVKLSLLMKGYCHYPPSLYHCCLIDLKKNRLSQISKEESRTFCSECMDYYDWLLSDYLKNKVKFYKGKNNCQLKTFVVRWLNTKEFFVDWKYKKYKRIHTPQCIQEMGELEQKIYILLRKKQLPYDIALRLDIPFSKASEMIEKIGHKLVEEGLSDHVYSPKFVSGYSVNEEGDETYENNIPPTVVNFMSGVLSKKLLPKLKESMALLPAHMFRVLDLSFTHEMTAKEILTYCKKVDYSIVPDKASADLTERDVYSSTNKALKKMMTLMEAGFHIYQDNVPDKDNLKTVFREFIDLFGDKLSLNRDLPD